MCIETIILNNNIIKHCINYFSVCGVYDLVPIALWRQTHTYIMIFQFYPQIKAWRHSEIASQSTRKSKDNYLPDIFNGLDRIISGAQRRDVLRTVAERVCRAITLPIIWIDHGAICTSSVTHRAIEGCGIPQRKIDRPTPFSKWQVIVQTQA
jgi:hypothetical protein